MMGHLDSALIGAAIAHRGTIAANQNPDVGTTIEFTLSLSLVAGER